MTDRFDWLELIPLAAAHAVVDAARACWWVLIAAGVVSIALLLIAELRRDRPHD